MECLRIRSLTVLFVNDNTYPVGVRSALALKMCHPVQGQGTPSRW